MSTWTTKLRAPTAGLALAAACAAVTPGYAAERASKQENVGVATGLLVGAAAGGPIGAIVGASAGAFLGDRYHRQAVSRDALAADLSHSETERTKLKGDLAEQLAHGEHLGRALDHTRDLETAVAFRTGAATLSAEDVARLRKLGSLAGALDDATVTVAGYTDPRGSETFNTELSRHRAQAVAAVLSEAGVQTDRLVVEAHGKGESTSAEGDLDGYALERRVTVRIEQQPGEAVARRE